MDFGTGNILLLIALMIYIFNDFYRFLISLNPYDFTSLNKQESYDFTTKKKAEKILSENIKK
tara:strand:+ start:238 stop:423 length:186 start_codon:yes stop_codon:yes gene_type:complete